MADKKPGLFGRAVRFAAMPVLVPAKQIGESINNTRARLEQIRQAKEARSQRLRELESMSSMERFEKLYDDNKWDEPALINQLQAIRKAKWAALISGLVWVVILGASMFWIEQGIIAALLVIIMIAVMALSAINLFKFSLYETQIRLRALITSKEFMSRQDMLARIFS